MDLFVSAEQADHRELWALCMLYKFPVELYDEDFRMLNTFYEENGTHNRRLRQKQLDTAQPQQQRQQEESSGISAMFRCGDRDGFDRAKHAGEPGAFASAVVVRLVWSSSAGHYSSVSFGADYQQWLQS